MFILSRIIDTEHLLRPIFVMLLFLILFETSTSLAAANNSSIDIKPTCKKHEFYAGTVFMKDYSGKLTYVEGGEIGKAFLVSNSNNLQATDEVILWYAEDPKDPVVKFLKKVVNKNISVKGRFATTGGHGEYELDCTKPARIDVVDKTKSDFKDEFNTNKLSEHKVTDNLNNITGEYIAPLTDYGTGISGIIKVDKSVSSGNININGYFSRSNPNKFSQYNNIKGPLKKDNNGNYYIDYLEDTCKTIFTFINGFILEVSSKGDCNKNIGQGLEFNARKFWNDKQEPAFKKQFNEKVAAAKKNKDIVTVIELLKNNDTPESLYMLGSMYIDGDGVRRDVDKAYLYFRGSVELGYLPAIIKMINLLQTYNDNQQEDEINQLIVKAALNNHAQCQYLLGKSYLDQSRSRNYESNNLINDAKFWLTMSSNQGYAEAINLLKTLK